MSIKRLRELKLGKIASALFIPTTVGIAIFLLIRDSIQLPINSIHLNIPLILLSFIVECAGLLIAIPIWRQILVSFDIKSLLRDDIRIYCYSALGAVLPGSIWTIAGRTLLYQKIGAKGFPVTSASLTETLIVGVAAMGVYLFSTFLRPEISLIKRPELGIIFSVLALLFIHPRVFNSTSNWLLKRTQKESSYQHIEYGFATLAFWLFFEIIVVIIGGLAAFILLKSLLPVSIDLLLPMIVSWAAAVAVGNLFFWIPGTPLLRDGAMVIALTTELSLPLALIIVALIRIWTIGSLLTLASLVWLFIDRPYQKTKVVGE